MNVRLLHKIFENDKVQKTANFWMVTPSWYKVRMEFPGLVLCSVNCNFWPLFQDIADFLILQVILDHYRFIDFFLIGNRDFYGLKKFPRSQGFNGMWCCNQGRVFLFKKLEISHIDLTLFISSSSMGTILHVLLSQPALRGVVVYTLRKKSWNEVCFVHTLRFLCFVHRIEVGNVVNIKECHSKAITRIDIPLLEDNFYFVKIT